MATRKDQLHSYQFMMQRVISSIMLHETDPEQTPLRRGVGAVFGGVMLTGLLAIAFAVYGVISGNVGSRWQEEGAIVIERETGAHYVYQGGVLRPVLNYASARLLTTDTEAKRVPGRNLAGIPRSVPVGIPGAPTSLPPVGRIVGAPWAMCSTVGRDPSGAPLPTTSLLVGGLVPGMFPIGARALLVRDFEDGTRYLVWDSHRYRFAGDDEPEVDSMILSLFGRADPTPAGTAWLNGLPAGEDIAPVEIPDLGDGSSEVSRPIGTVLFHEVGQGRNEHYLVLDDGLAPISQLQVLLLEAAYGEELKLEQISPAEANAAAVSDQLTLATGPGAAPPVPPGLADVPADGASLCAETGDGRSPPRITVGIGPEGGLVGVPTAGESPDGVRFADSVLVPPGHIAVIRALPSDTAEVGAYYLVTDVGIRYAVPSAETLARLGYDAANHATEMPAALVQRIPAGPTLDPAAAQRPAAVG